jgi:hypothetical protein
MLKPYQKRALVVGAVLVPPLFILYAIFAYGVPVPYWDQWELVPLLQKLNNHSLGFADLWAQHNEHRIVLPRAVMLFLARLTGWNIYYEFVTSFLIALATFILLWSMLRKTFEGRPPVWLLVAFSLVAFSPIQYDNWLWGWQIQFFMTNLGAVAAVWSLQKWPDRFKGLAFAIIAVVFSSFSLGSGLFLWMAIMPVIFLARPRNWSHIILWCIAAAATLGLYLNGYLKPPAHPSPFSFMQHPREFIKYVFIYIGSPLGFIKPDAALIMGILIIIVATAILIAFSRYGTGGMASLLPWIALGLQAILCAIGTGVGRAGFGARQALSSRYSTFASLLLLAVLVIAASWLAIRRKEESGGQSFRHRTVATALLAIFAVTYALSFAHSLHAMEYKRKELQACRNELMAFPNSSKEALGKLFHPEMINATRDRVQALRDMGMILPPEPAAK